MHGLSIIIVNFETINATSACISSIYNSSLRFDVEVWVVDNGSTDNSPEIIKRKFPQVKLIANHHNLFYTQANNQALKKIKSKYFLILNSDVSLVKNSLQQMFDFMEKHPECGLSGCLQTDKNGKILITSHRSHQPLTQILLLPTFYRLFKHTPFIKRFLYADWDRHDTRQVDAIPGSFMFGQTKILKKIGYLDESMLLFYSDADLCERIRKNGYCIFHNGQVTVTHEVSTTLTNFSRHYIEHTAYQDMVRYYHKHLGRTWGAIIFIFTRIAILTDITYLIKYFQFSCSRIYCAYETWRDYYKLIKLFPKFRQLEKLNRKNYQRLKRQYLDYTANISLDYMAISLETAVYLLSLCQILQPKKIADLGSGFSSYVFNAYKEESGHHVEILSVDDDAKWLKKTRDWLNNQHIESARLISWNEFYRRSRVDFDLIFHDLGNMDTRIQTLPKILSLIRFSGFVVLDDLQFPDYNSSVRKIVKTSGFQLLSLRKITKDIFGRYASLVHYL